MEETISVTVEDRVDGEDRFSCSKIKINKMMVNRKYLGLEVEIIAIVTHLQVWSLGQIARWVEIVILNCYPSIVNADILVREDWKETSTMAVDVTTTRPGDCSLLEDVGEEDK